MRTLSTLLVLSCGTLTFGQAGTLDPTLGGLGIIITAIGQGGHNGNAVAVQPDGKIVVAGYYGSLTSSFAVLRYHVDGSLDSTFDADGIVITDVTSQPDAIHSLVVQPDGRIVVAGRSYDAQQTKFSVARYNPDGSLDPTFDQDGIVLISVGGEADVCHSMILQPDGKIVLAGSCQLGTNDDFALVRIHPDGTLDNSFSQDGRLITAIGAEDDDAFSAALQSDGRIVVVGETDNGTDLDLAVVRYNADGSLDANFGIGGMVTTAIGNNRDNVRSVVIQPDGKILVGGHRPHAPYEDGFIIRYHADGTVDTSFGANGIVLTDGPASEVCGGLALQADGKIVFAGYAHDGGVYALLMRCEQDGSKDLGFGTNGQVITTQFAGGTEVRAVAMQNDGRIVVSGDYYEGLTGDHMMLLRYLSGLNIGMAEFSARDHNVFIYPNPIDDQAVLEFELRETTRLTCRVNDAQGMVVRTLFANAPRTAGPHREEVVLTGLPAGAYSIMLTDGSGRVSVRIVKQ
ncbi:MAG: T9SS type A sorting domain-containing protein [Flavobacteriales bacterium]|nr:T9SS type A sorting domain-containing protein [Flavobacteriales bacterium]MBP6696419.1 T9SS type A sorting domain-containing protein [Flavobacteriales bacterium]